MNLANTVLVTHKNCADGSTCALLFMAAGGKKENIRFSNPSHIDSDELVSEIIQTLTLENKDKLLLVDISISKDMAEFIDTHFYRNDIFILDHHASAVPLNQYDWCKIDVDNQSCGCKLFYDWLMSNSTEHHDNIHKYKELVEIVDDNDRWIHNIPESMDFAQFFEILGQELFIERFMKHSTADLDAQELYLIRMHNKKQDIDIENKKRHVKILTREIDGNSYNFGFVVAGGTDASMLGHAICSDMKLNVDVVVILNGDVISFRSKASCPVDLSKIAKKFAGGGHKGASGCQVVGVLGKDLIDLISEHMRFDDESNGL